MNFLTLIRSSLYFISINMVFLSQEKEILFGQHYSTLLQQWPYCPLPHPPLSNLFSNGSGPLSGIYMWPKQPKALVEQELGEHLSTVWPL